MQNKCIFDRNFTHKAEGLLGLALFCCDVQQKCGVSMHFEQVTPFSCAYLTELFDGCYKINKQIMKNDKENAAETQVFNVEKHLQHRGEKSRAPARKTSLYWGVFINVGGYLII
jgi:hypothetical protein